MDDSVVAEQRQFVLFQLGEEVYGLPIEAVRSIIRYEQPTPVPRAPEGVEGVFNLRGQVLPLVDLGRRLRAQAIVPTSASRIVVVESELGPVGLAVDLVYEVATLPADEIRPAPPAALSGEMADAIEGVATHGDRLVILLAPDKALPKPAIASAGMPQEGGLDA